MTREVKKATTEEIENARRIERLRVHEVSVVDRPAIRRPFLLVKRESEKAEWSTAFINDLPDSSFLHVESGGKKDGEGKTTPRSLRHFPYKDASGKVDLPHLRNALSRIPQSKLPSDVKERVTAQARRVLADQEKAVGKAEEEELEAAIDSVRKALEELGFVMTKVDPKGLPSELTASLESVVPWMRQMAGQAEGNDKKAIKMVAAWLASMAGGEMPMSVKNDEKKDEKKAEEMDEEEMKRRKAKEKEEAEKASATKKDEETKSETKQPKTKALALDDDGTALIVKVDREGDVQVISKGSKKLTTARIAALREAATKTLSLLKEADAEEFEKAVETVRSEKEMPKDPNVASMVRPEGEGSTNVAKKDEAPAWAQRLEKKFDDGMKRVENIEKARSPSTSVAEDGGNDSKETQVKKSFWSGVLS